MALDPIYKDGRQEVLIEYAKNTPGRQILGGPDRPAPALSLSRRDLRRRSRLQQYRGMVSVDPSRPPPGQGSALLSSARAKRPGRSLRGLCLRAESRSRRRERPHSAPHGGRAFRAPGGRSLRVAGGAATIGRYRRLQVKTEETA